MAQFNYARAKVTADRLIERFGRVQPMPFRREVRSGGTSFAPTLVEHHYQVRGVVLPASKGTIQAFDNRFDQGQLIDERLRFVILSATMIPVNGAPEIEPKAGDIITFDGSDWRVIGNTPLKPAETAVYYGLGVMR